MTPVMQFTGALRVYFHRHGTAPMMWCVSPEDAQWEIAVRTVCIHTSAETVYHPKETPDDDEDGRPSGWIATTGTCRIFADGTATITED